MLHFVTIELNRYYIFVNNIDLLDILNKIYIVNYCDILH